MRLVMLLVLSISLLLPVLTNPILISQGDNAICPPEDYNFETEIVCDLDGSAATVRRFIPRDGSVEARNPTPWTRGILGKLLIRVKGLLEFPANKRAIFHSGVFEYGWKWPDLKAYAEENNGVLLRDCLVNPVQM